MNTSIKTDDVIFNFFQNFILENQIKGIDRIVPLGRSMEMSYLWDGYNLLRALTRIIDIK